MIQRPDQYDYFKSTKWINQNLKNKFNCEKKEKNEQSLHETNQIEVKIDLQV